MNENNFVIVMILTFILGICLIISTCFIGAYYYHKMEVDNFQITIKDLSEEQKCLHICGFEFGNLLENYKFCAEKCDRISERLNGEIQK